MTTSCSTSNQSCCGGSGAGKGACSGSITLAELKEKLKSCAPDGSDRSKGYALVNVLPEHYFLKEHIPGSINIDYENPAEFERRFDKEKEIIVYCASVTCSAGPDMAKTLAAKGFTKVRDFPGGTKEWKEAGLPLGAGQASQLTQCGCC